MRESMDQKNSKYGLFWRVTFFDILLQKRALTVEAMFVSQVERGKGELVQGFEKYEGDL